MKNRLILALFLVMIAASVSSTTIRQPSLYNQILNSESVITAQIVSGRCLLTSCKESRPHISRKEYVIKCTGSMAGQCPQKTHFRSASELKIGAMYILIMLPDKDGLPSIFSSLELQNDNKEVVFGGAMRGLPNVTLYKRASRFESITVNYYYRYNDFASAVKSVKNDPSFKN